MRGLFVLAGIIVIVGILLIASQYLGDLTTGASAEVLNYEELPQTLEVDKEEYRKALDLVSQYGSVDDLATKNNIIQELEEELLNWAN